MYLINWRFLNKTAKKLLGISNTKGQQTSNKIQFLAASHILIPLGNRTEDKTTVLFKKLISSCLRYWFLSVSFSIIQNILLLSSRIFFSCDSTVYCFSLPFFRYPRLKKSWTSEGTASHLYYLPGIFFAVLTKCDAVGDVIRDTNKLFYSLQMIYLYQFDSSAICMKLTISLFQNISSFEIRRSFKESSCVGM